LATQPLYAGLHRNRYPGDDLMRHLREHSNLHWTGFYLAPAPAHQKDTSWMDRLPVLREMGWGLAPIYVGQQRSTRLAHALTEEQGCIDAEHAAVLAASAGFESGSVIFLDIEQGPPLAPEMMTYYAAWVETLCANTNFTPGVYCSYRDIADDLYMADDRPIFWVWQLRYTCDPAVAKRRGWDVISVASDRPRLPENDPRDSGVPFARIVHHAANACSFTLGERSVGMWDFDCALTPNPADPSTYPG
jgi:hypothetical protein